MVLDRWCDQPRSSAQLMVVIVVVEFELLSVPSEIKKNNLSLDIQIVCREK